MPTAASAGNLDHSQSAAIGSGNQVQTVTVDNLPTAIYQMVVELYQWRGAIDERLETIEKALLGNGSPGVVEVAKENARQIEALKRRKKGF